MLTRVRETLTRAFGSLLLTGAVASGMAREALASALAKTAHVVEAVHAPSFRYDVECLGRDGCVKWRESVFNLVTTGGKNDLLTNYFKGSAYTAAFYVGLVDNASFSAISAADTAASHGGWLESSAFSNANRPTLILGTPSGGSVDNSASKAVFNINASATINGAFVVTNNTKGGTTGVLYSASSFGATRAVASGDTLNVQVTLSV
jgi:hypothetical protein